jgi:hypothetical protein
VHDLFHESLAGGCAVEYNRADMTPENASAVEPEPARMGEFSRLTGVFFEPGKTFADIAERPRWLVPLLLVIVAGLAFYFLYGQHVGWERFLRHQMETNARVQQSMERIPAAQRDAAIAMQTKFMGIEYYFGTIVMVPLMYVISAAIVLGIASGMMSAGVKFKQVFAIICYAGLPMVLKHALATVVMFLKSPDEFNLLNPLAFNPAAFMDPINSSKFLYTLAMSFDLFTIWVILLTATGLKAAAGKMLSFGGALFAVVLPWAILVLGGATLAGMFS